MAMTPVIGAVSASLPPEVYANMRAYNSHKSPEQVNVDQSASSRDSGRAVVKTFDIDVSLGWDATVQEFQDWQTELNNANKGLYDATDGQVAFRKIDIYNNRQKWDSVNIHVNHGSGRAYTIRGGIQWGGAYIELYSVNDINMGGRVILHEWGHYGMFLPDEYTDSHGPFCKCLQGTTYDTNEWCSESNHCNYDPSYCASHGEAQSCWKQMPQYYPVMTEKNPPTAGPYDAPAPQFVWHFPDLYTSSDNIQITPFAPKMGDQVTITVDIFNKETLVKNNIDVSFYDNYGGSNTLIGARSYYISGYITSATYSWTAVAGTHLLSAVIDAGNIIKEINEDNNTALLTVHVNSPPEISTNLKELRTKEDTDLVVDMSKYESDTEDGNDNSTLKWTVTQKDTKVITKVSGENSADDVLTFSVPAQWNGKTKVTFTLTDSVGLKATKEANLFWDPVNDQPWVDSILITNPLILRTESTTIKVLTKDIEDTISSMTPSLDHKLSSGDIWMPLTMQLVGDAFEANLFTDVTTPSGMYDLRAKVTDSAGLSSEYYYLNRSLDIKNNPPEVQQVTFEDSVSEVYRTQELTIQLTASDIETPTGALNPVVKVSSCDDEDWTELSVTPELIDDYWVIKYTPPADLPAGQYCFAVTVFDEQNEESERKVSEPMTILNNAPTVKTIESPEKTVLRSQTITLTVKGGDIEDPPGDLKLEINYKLGAGGNWEAAYIEGISYTPGGTGNDGIWSARFFPTKSAKMGDYLFSARLTDKEAKPGEWFESQTFQVEVKNNNPTAVIVPVKELTEGTTGTFDATGSKDLEDTGLTYTWDFGDKKTAKGLRVNHAFTKPGKFTVTLTVEDSDGGKTSANVVVSVKAKPIFTSGGTSSAGGLNMFVILAIVLVVVLVVVLTLMLSRRKKAKAQDLPPPLMPSTPGSASLTDIDEPAPTHAPSYQVEAYKVYDDSNVIQSKTYGDQEMRRAYK